MPFSVDFTGPQKVDNRVVTRLPSHLKVSCQKADFCTSPSKRKRGFVCGSDFSHDDRLRSCVEYYRLCRGRRGGCRV